MPRLERRGHRRGWGMSFVMRARAPRAPAPASALLQPALQPPPPSPVPGPEWRVLIVDSDPDVHARSEEHTSELQSQSNLVCRLLLEKKKKKHDTVSHIQN